MRNWNWSKIKDWFIDITWALMLLGYIYLWFYVSPQYLDYQEHKESYQDRVEILRSEEELIKQEREEIKKLRISLERDRVIINNQRAVIHDNIIKINERLKLLKEKRDLLTKDTLTNEELSVRFNLLFGDAYNN